MNQGPFSDRAGMAAAVLALLAVVVGLAALLDVWPFDDPEELTVAEFIARGDEYCAEAHDEFRDLQRRTPFTPGDAAELAEALITVAREERDAIAELGAPLNLADAVERYLDERDRGIELLEEGRAAAEAADALSYEEAQAELAASQLERFELARRVGFRECSKPLSSREELEELALDPRAPDAPPIVSNPPPE